MGTENVKIVDGSLTRTYWKIVFFIVGLIAIAQNYVGHSPSLTSGYSG